MTTIGLLLAGGRSRRMGGGDKFLREIAGVRLLDRCLSRLAPQVDRIVLSANGNEGSLAGYDLPIAQDAISAGCGPLAGILAGLQWGRANCGRYAVVISMPTDTPFFPADLATRLTSALTNSGAEIAVAESMGQLHHAIGAWRVSLEAPLEQWLSAENSPAVHRFLSTRRIICVDFGGSSDPFFNINTPGDLARAIDVARALPAE